MYDLKFLSDVECYPETNSFAVEWEYESGYRYWESFETEVEMQSAIDFQQKQLMHYELDALLEEASTSNRYINFNEEIGGRFRPYHSIMKFEIDAHNKRLRNARNPKPTTFNLGALFQKAGIYTS